MPRARRLRPLDIRGDQADVTQAEQDELVEEPTPQPTPEHIPANEVFETPLLPEREVLLPVDPLYERQHSLGLHTPSVALIGCGGVGCWVALSLVLGGVTDLTLFDGDTLSVHNLNRFPLPEGSIGELKSVALARWLRTLRPKVEISARGEFDPAMHSPNVEWVVCATDSLKSRRLCHDYATQVVRAKYLEVGADGERWGLSPSPPEFSTELEDQAGYQTVPVHVGPCMMAGAAAAYYVLHDCSPIVSHSCDWKVGPVIYSKPNLGGLKFESMSEEEFKIVACPQCGVEVEASLVPLIKHIREHGPDTGLVEAKAIAERILAEVPAVEPEIDEMVEGDYIPDEQEADNG